MGLLSFFRKTPEPKQPTFGLPQPYADNTANLIYNLLFCDNVELYRANTQKPSYPFTVLFSDASTPTQLQKVINVPNADPRIKALAYNRQLAAGHKPDNKELMAVIVEVGLNNGLDVLASFSNGTARYINYTGKVLVWETTDDATANALASDLFTKSRVVVAQIGAWDQPRRPAPAKGAVRITFLVSDGLYFGEGPMDTMFKDPMAGPALTAATMLMQYLTEKAVNTK